MSPNVLRADAGAIYDFFDVPTCEAEFENILDVAPRENWD